MKAESQTEAAAFDAAALLLLGDGATAAELADRFARHAELQHPAGASELLGRLARLGLATALPDEEAGVRYAVTTLGEQFRGAAPGAHPDVQRRLEELERLRTDLLATIAHELRTPLTAVKTCCGLLLDPDVRPDAEARLRLLETIARSADRMQRLVSDVLDLARLRSGRFQLQSRRFDARGLAREAAAAVAPLRAGRAGLTVEAPDAPLWVFGDHRRLEQALLNLLSNAHRYSPADAPIRLRVDAHGGEIRWTVEDRGPGIPEADRARLFERFFTGARDLEGGGTGLGLPIALAIARAHGGTIDVETEVGRGSRFTLRVPAGGPPGQEAG